MHSQSAGKDIWSVAMHHSSSSLSKVLLVPGSPTPSVPVVVGLDRTLAQNDFLLVGAHSVTEVNGGSFSFLFLACNVVNHRRLDGRSLANPLLSVLGRSSLDTVLEDAVGSAALRSTAGAVGDTLRHPWK